MTKPILLADKLSKRYRILPSTGAGWRRNQRVLVDDIVRTVARVRGKEYTEKKISFWALKDVSFEARPGDVIGIIGRNGAGKSTLLKLLGRVTEPTSGRAEIYGRVGSLLEVGTGFHSELTGRENIFISGAIIGMSRSEIKRKFDEIVAFSGVEEFLDTPVKRFSSGMEVRLAFSVAAHLQPNVLLVDEVLSVGDASFRQKSLEKIREVSDYGGTILFVSHNMNTVASLCSQAIVLEHGQVVFPLGPVGGAVDFYLADIARSQKAGLEQGRQGGLPGHIRITGFTMRDGEGTILETLTSGQDIQFQVDYQVEEGRSLKEVNLAILVRTLRGDVIANLNSQRSVGDLNLPTRTGQMLCTVKKLPLAPGKISISLVLEQNSQPVDRINDVYIGQVDSGGHLQRFWSGDAIGWLVIDQEWSVG